MDTMRTRRINLGTSSVLLAGVAAMLFAAGCGASNDKSSENGGAEEIGAALELENGGLTMDDEAPMFAETSAFQDAMDPETPITDELDNTPEITSMQQKPDAVKFEVAVMWGQIPTNLANTTPHKWNGKISVSRGALLVRKAIRFEDKTDHLLPRTDPREVAFTSVTLPANDGLRLTVIDPTPQAPEPLTISYETQDGLVYAGPMKALVDGPESVEVDDAGNRFVGVAMATPVDVCQFGMLGGKWHRVKPGRGILLGGVVGALGEPLGHVKGIYGVRKNGEQVFFGKYIDADGHFRGIFAGHYGNGGYEGKWLHASGEVGALGGHYFEDIPGPETGGKFIGRWAETSCNLNVGPGPGGPLPPQP
jgi:hypothetical protein